MRMNPSAHPFKTSTQGKDKTPDPIAEAHNEKILPLKDPFSSFPKVLLKNGLL